MKHQEDQKQNLEKNRNTLAGHIITLVQSADENQLRIIYRFVLTLTKNK